MNQELLGALEILEKEKNISKSIMLNAIEKSLIDACARHYGPSVCAKVVINPDTCDYQVFVEKTVVEDGTVEDSNTQIGLSQARMQDPHYQIGDTVQLDINTRDFCRIAAGQARQTITQTIREQEKKAVYNYYNAKLHASKVYLP